MQYITGRIADSVAAISSFAKNRTSTPGQDELLARQRISDVRLSIEYKYLVDHAPGGVFMLPALGDNRTLYGVIFVRRGLYRNGVFHFTVKLPSEYNSLGVSPQVTFNPPVFNPLVNPTTGSMQLTLSDTLLDVWIPEKHFLATVVTAIKKMFYMKSYETFPSGCLADESARALFESNKPVFLEKVEDCVRRSLQEAEGMVGMDARAIKPANVGSIQFSCEQPAHAILRQAILGELTAARAAELQERRSKAADAEGLPVAATINQSPLPYHFHANNGADNESMAVDAALNIDAEARLLAEEVMNALDIFKVPLDSSHPAWDIPQGTLSSNELGKGEAVGLSSAGMAAFYDLSNEVEDECDANTISVVNMK